MNAIRNATLAAAALFGLGLAHAGEITEFPIVESSTVSRADVKAAAEAANRAGALRHDFIGPAQQPMSMKSREEVRHEAVQRRSTNVASASPIVGGM